MIYHEMKTTQSNIRLQKVTGAQDTPSIRSSDQRSAFQYTEEPASPNA